MVISLAQKLLSCAKFRPLRVNKKKDLILLTLDRQALLQRRNVSSRGSRWFGKRHKTDAFTKPGVPTIRAAACTPQCLAGISKAFSASFIRTEDTVVTVDSVTAFSSAVGMQSTTRGCPPHIGSQSRNAFKPAFKYWNRDCKTTQTILVK